MRKRVPKILMTAVLLAGASAARAQASRTWVSGVGDDANPCSRTAPCKTFAGAISKTAAGGEINALDPGGFGAVTITKSISIIGDGVIAGISAAGTNGIIVNAGINDVITVRGLDIDGMLTGLNGIRFLAGAALHVENCIIYGFTQKGLDIRPTTNGARLFVQNTIVRDNPNTTNGGGIFIRPGVGGTVDAELNHVTLDKNLFGLRVEDGGNATIHESETSGNSQDGMVAVSSTAAGALIFVANSTTSNNGTNGVRSEGGNSAVRLSNVNITGNGTGLASTFGGAIVSFGNNHNSGNGVDGAPTITILPQ